MRDWLTVSCPHCKGECLVPDDSDDTETFYCPTCDQGFRLGAPRTLLDWLEIKLRGMTVGTVVFVFRRIPAWLCGLAEGLLRGLANLCRWLVPFSWKLARVVCWLLLWLGLLAGPAWLLGRVLPLLAPRSAWPGLLATGWLLLAVCGSAWGFLHYRRRRKVACVGATPPPLPEYGQNGGPGAVTHAGPLLLEN